MNQLAKVKADMAHCDMDVTVQEWTLDDPFPKLGPSVGVDTETELITRTVLFPKLVVLGVFDPSAATCYIAYADSAPEFVRRMCRLNVQQRYFNVGFDEGVLSNEDPDAPLLEALDSGRVRDMQIRIHMNSIATLGFIPGNLWTLDQCSRQLLGCALDKGDGSEDSARMSFRRGRPITEEQARYLAFDCITTWALGEAVSEQPLDPATGMSVEVGHVQGMCVLAHISANGFPVDEKVRAAMETKLLRDRDKWRVKLLEYGFPDPYRDPAKDRAGVSELFDRSLQAFTGQSGPFQVPKKGNLRLMLVQMWNHSDEPGEAEDMRRDVLAACSAEKTNMNKAVTGLWDSMLEDFGLEAFEASRNSMALAALTAKCLELLAAQDPTARGYDAGGVFMEAASWMDEHPEYTSTGRPIGPRDFFQQHVTELLLDQCPGGADETLKAMEVRKADSPFPWSPADELEFIMSRSRLQLETTEKSGDVQLTKKDMWRLADLGIRDGFLEAYTSFVHCQKYLSTYLDPKWVAEDGKVHARYMNLKATGRTSASSPNV